MDWYSKIKATTLKKASDIGEESSEQPRSKVDLSSFDAFMKSLKTLPREEIRRLQQEMNSVQERSFMPGPGWKKLYHGTDSSIADKIRGSGFQAGEGRRSGFMGMTKTVANQGVFLSDDASSARYFGQNRSDDPRAADLVTCYADVSKVMNFDSPPPPVRRLGLSILNKYEGTRKTRLALRDWWWLLDQPEFVSSIKEAGFSGELRLRVFREAPT